MSSPHSRRTFFSFATAAAVAATRRKAVAANDKVDVAVIGLGGRGQSHMNIYSKLPDANIVALCDVNQAALERGQALVLKLTGKTPKGYADMREVFDDKSVQAVSMPVPNHWHALSTIWACQAGKDVYIEKPACWNVFEGQQMIAAARKYSRMVQVGSQSRSMEHKIKAMNLLHEGVIGKVYLAKGLCFKRRLSIGHKDDEPIPAGLDWDKFLGPAPMRPYNELRFRYNWHWFWDTGNGDIGNQGIHEMDIARWGLNRGLPQSVSSTGGKYYVPANDDQETPNTQMATFNYGNAEIMFEVRGGLTGPEGGLQIRGGNTVADLFYGSEGWMAVDGAGFQVYKGKMDGKVEKQEKVMDEVKSSADDTGPHMENFLAAVKNRDYKSLTADVEIAVASADLVHMANTSYRLKRTLKFDENTRKYVGDDEANKMLTRNPYRKPYVVPEKV
ncbi:MAG TPA: Gfo/Idh/MocA family oxidoreductase [Bryobacteraceae bacterium]|jgi:predicted dehydrogenase|nr:Gfo/Idh/MocA family oxidoreductase [Bryobacteraceae bacterium]